MGLGFRVWGYWGYYSPHSLLRTRELRLGACRSSFQALGRRVARFRVSGLGVPGLGLGVP